MRKTLLEKCEEVVEATYFPFGKNNLKTSKIFNDLVQFYNEGGMRSTIQTIDETQGSKGMLKAQLNQVRGSMHAAKKSLRNSSMTGVS